MALQDILHEELTTPKFISFSLSTFASPTLNYRIILNLFTYNTDVATLLTIFMQLITLFTILTYAAYNTKHL